MTDTNSDPFDIANFEASESAWLDVNDMAGEPLLYKGAPVRIALYGPGSAAYVKADAKAAAASSARAFAAMRGKPGKTDAEEAKKTMVDKLAACTQTIENFPIPGGAASLYANPKLGYITNQVVRFLDDWQNFKPGSVTV